MSSLLIALALLAQPMETAPPTVSEPAPAAEAPYPSGAPQDDYRFVAWCYGALRSYLDLHDEVMPEVTRIETTYRKPGTNVADDLKVYADMQRLGEKQIVVFQKALTAAEKASMRPINVQGAEAMARGAAIWRGGSMVSKARLAQEWMSWTLPARCEAVAVSLEERSVMAAQLLKANVEPAPEAAAPELAPESAPAPPAGALGSLMAPSDGSPSVN